MIESISNLSIWQLLILTINIFIFTYFMGYISSKAFFSAYFKCKEKHILEVGKITKEMKIKIEKSIVEKINKENKENNSGMVNEIFSLIKKEGERLDNQLEEEKKEVPNAGLEDQKESVHK